MPDFSPALAVSLSRLCAATYDQLNAYQKKNPWVPPAGCPLVGTITVPYEDAHLPIGFVTRQGGTLTVAWRGTDNPAEWVQDAKYEQVPCKFGLPHDLVEVGFWELYTSDKGGKPSPRDQVWAIAQQFPQEPAMIVTGHSLGGALATLNAYDLSRRGKTITVYTFASPRTGNPTFCQNFHARAMDTWRVFNTNDEVPRLPPEDCPPILPQYHYGHVDQAKPVTFGNALDLALDHSIDGYIKAMEALV